MNSRFWDPEEKYANGVIKEYKYWNLEVSFRQHTLGCFIIFCKRDIQRISELTDYESNELKLVMKHMERSVVKAFGAERFNYFQMGNQLHNLHLHGIPRYSSEKSFFDKIWKDNTFGHPPSWTKEEIDNDLVEKIRIEVLKYL
jgi:diadenosine tetraphosphate (Ap4A) HIT family hydrolase